MLCRDMFAFKLKEVLSIASATDRCEKVSLLFTEAYKEDHQKSVQLVWLDSKTKRGPTHETKGIVLMIVVSALFSQLRICTRLPPNPYPIGEIEEVKNFLLNFIRRKAC